MDDSIQSIRDRLQLVSFRTPPPTPDVASRSPKRPRNLFDPPSEGTQVSVVMTTYNSCAYMDRAIDSILGQSHQNVELIVVDDASTDGTLEALYRRRSTDSRLRVFSLRRNRGTYWAKNLGMLHATGTYITFQDSDDYSSPDRMARQLSALAGRPGALVCSAQYVRISSEGEWVPNRGELARLSYVSLMLERRHVLGTIGFFDSVRFAADDEFYSRLRRSLPEASIVHLEEPLYFASVREGSLTQVDRSELESGDDSLGHLSQARREYVLNYRTWHESAPRPVITFPMRSRPFPAPSGMWDQPPVDAITAALASIPSRVEGLRSVVESILPQVDALYVYLNGYTAVPTFLDHPRVTVARSQEFGDRRDNGKFFFDRPDGYQFTLDDDICYPSNYVAYLVSKLQQYDHHCVVGVHGVSLEPQLTSYLDRSTRRVDGFAQALSEDKHCHVLGTGTLAYHTQTMRVCDEDFETTGMADIWFAIHAKGAGVPLVSVARSAKFLRPIGGQTTNTLYDEFLGRDRTQTQLVRMHALWDPPKMGG